MPKKRVSFVGRKKIRQTATRAIPKRTAFFQWKAAFEARENPKFGRLFLPREAVKTNGRIIQIDFAEQMLATPLITRRGIALCVIKNPVIKDRIIVLRKTGSTKEPFGIYTLNAFWRGRENIIGEATLKQHQDNSKEAKLTDLEVVDEIRRKETSFTPAEAEKKWVFGSVIVIKKGDIKTYNYRGKKLSLLLFEVSEFLARKAGIKEVVAAFDPNTTGKFMPNYGWKKTEDSRFWHTKKL